RNQLWLDWKGKIIVNEKGKISGTWIGRNYAYRPIMVRCDENLFGKYLQVRITKACSTYLVGEVD
ncbi:MAG: TRAM domain-containing protein, partial [Crenarchaeota archaeon]|nr:TRAM domain-containing protein [Thermoproteota archaeon]